MRQPGESPGTIAPLQGRELTMPDLPIYLPVSFTPAELRLILEALDAIAPPENGNDRRATVGLDERAHAIQRLALKVWHNINTHARQELEAELNNDGA